MVMMMLMVNMTKSLNCILSIVASPLNTMSLLIDMCFTEWQSVNPQRFYNAGSLGYMIGSGTEDSLFIGGSNALAHSDMWGQDTEISCIIRLVVNIVSKLLARFGDGADEPMVEVKTMTMQSSPSDARLTSFSSESQPKPHKRCDSYTPVSYTHLTLPTILLV
eukprot:2856793-Amphidinium_carterae.1